VTGTAPAVARPAEAPGTVTPPDVPATRPARPRLAGARWWLTWSVAAAIVALAVAGLGYGLHATFGRTGAAPALGPGEVTVAIDVAHSRFEPGELRVVEGTRVRFVVANGDPINHELIVGPPEVHTRHAQGSEAEHPSVPGEVSVAPGTTGITNFRFDEPGTVEFACHLPGHYDYGMHGRIEVVAAS
jgi:uncharacterized cupredoxin-like copper-binding protein